LFRVSQGQTLEPGHERPHQALNGAYPGDVYTPSARVYEPPPEPDYPYHDRAVRVTRREVADQVWLVSFMDFDLGFFDHEQGRVEPALNLFAPEKVLTMSPE
jgi:putative transposase